MGIEPTSSAWKAEVLPLNYTRRWLHDDSLAPSSHTRRPQLSQTRTEVTRTTAPFASEGAWVSLQFLRDWKSLLPLSLVEGVGFEPTKA